MQFLFFAKYYEGHQLRSAEDSFHYTGVCT